jgi:hypothetical protein
VAWASLPVQAGSLPHKSNQVAIELIELVRRLGISAIASLNQGRTIGQGHISPDFSFLRTLPTAQVRNGMAKLVKIAVCHQR